MPTPRLSLSLVYLALALPGRTAAASACVTLAQDVQRAVALERGLPQRLDDILVDEPGDGNVWVLAPGYKARFGRDGVEFIPYYGPTAPRNYPTTFRLAEVTRGGRELPCAEHVTPRRDGDRIVYERGSLREIWNLRTREVEQTFELEASTGRGDLVVRVAVASESAAKDVDAGLHFEHAGFGGVLYGDVLTYDAAGGRHASPALWRAGHIELVVPASFVDRARGRLVVDPSVRSLTIDNGTDDTYAPDVAFEPTNKMWLVVYERRFSALDTDILARRYDALGNFLDIATVASGSRESHRPSVGANALGQQFLIAWDEDTGVSDREILARTRASGGTLQGTTNVMPSISGATQTDVAPKVGGSTATDSFGDRFLIVNEVRNAIGTPQLYNVVRVTGAGLGNGTSPGGTFGEQATDLAITKARGSQNPWLVTYVANGVLRAQFFLALNSVGSTLTVDGTLLELGPPAVCGIDNEFVVAYSRRTPLGDHNLRLVEVEFVGNSLRLGRSFDATALEPGAAIRNEQRHPAISFDGCRFSYAYLEGATATGDFDVYSAVVSIDTSLTFSDGHRALHAATAAELEGPPRIASMAEMGGDPGVHLVAYDRELSASDHDVRGNIFHGTTATAGVTVVPTACGGVLSPTISVENPPVLGAVLRVRAATRDPVRQFFLLGLETQPIPLCAANCRLGVLPLIATIPGVALDLPIACDLGLLGARIALQNLWVGGGGGCGSPQFAFVFNVSDTVVIEVQ